MSQETKASDIAITNSQVFTTLESARSRYHQIKSRREKSMLLDQLCATYGWHRKHAIRSMRNKEQTQNTSRKKRRYTTQVLQLLAEIKLLSGACSSIKLVRMIAIWLPLLEAIHGNISDATSSTIRSLGAVTLDRLFSRCSELLEIKQIRSILDNKASLASPYKRLRGLNSVGNIWIVEVNLTNTSERGILVFDQLTNWTKVINCSAVNSEQLLEEICNIPFQINCAYIHVTSVDLASKLQEKLWKRESPAAVSTEIIESPSIELNKLTTSNEFTIWYNNGIPLQSINDSALTPSMMLSVNCLDTIRTITSPRASELYNSAKMLIEKVTGCEYHTIQNNLVTHIEEAYVEKYSGAK